jgi:aspartate racemase
VKQIGIVGGLSWHSTAEYYRLINELTREQLGDHRSARLLVDSLDEQAFLDAQARVPSEAACGDLIVASVARLSGAGADVIALCANGVHRFAPAIRRRTGVEVVHIAQATAAAAAVQGLKKVGLLGVRKTMEGDFYREKFTDVGIEVIVPAEEERAYVHDAVVKEMTLGNFTAETRAAFVDICQELGDRGADGVVLGCTEIPLLLRDAPDPGFPLLPTTDIHCAAIVRAALDS